MRRRGEAQCSGCGARIGGRPRSSVCPRWAWQWRRQRASGAMVERRRGDVPPSALHQAVLTACYLRLRRAMRSMRWCARRHCAARAGTSHWCRRCRRRRSCTVTPRSPCSAITAATLCRRRRRRPAAAPPCRDVPSAPASVRRYGSHCSSRRRGCGEVAQSQCHHSEMRQARRQRASVPVPSELLFTLPSLPEEAVGMVRLTD